MKNKILGLDIDALVESVVKEMIFENEDPIIIKTKEEIAQREAEAAKKARQTAYKRVSDAKADQAKGILPEEGSPDENTEKKAAPVKLTQDDLPDIDMPKVIEKINLMRAGKSLKDKAIQKQLNDYWDKLNGNERVALYAFMSGISKILSGTEGAVVKTPKSEPFDVEMDKDAKTIEKADIKNPKAQRTVKKPDQTNTSSENAPIVVGEAASKRNILKILKSNQ